jgi:predicted XRE-type DNA-binding protein
MSNKKKQKKSKEIEFQIGSDNIFADIGVENPEEELTKAELTWEIDQIIRKKKLTQQKAAEIMGINQPKVSALLHGKLEGFSVERLIHFLNALGQDIDIVVRPKPRGRKTGRISVYSSGESPNYSFPIAAKAR